ncbi:MAG: hypothetical protein NTW56_15105 [Alphaproteobacteria bacterium]|jgi:hypothetical protein|nr:hypothetical protein [Alphaproteobacteria bacterium]
MAETQRRDVSTSGKMLGLSIFGGMVAFVIIAENLGMAEVVNRAPMLLAASLALAIALPVAFFRR